MEKKERSSIINCRQLSKIWYGIFIICLQAYVHYDEVNSYLNFKTQSNDPRYGLQWNENPLTFCLMMTMISFALLPIFLHMCILKTGNLVNDNVFLGDSDMFQTLRPNSLLMRRIENCHDQSQKLKCWDVIKYHISPSYQWLHYISAFILLVPQTYLNAEKFKNSALSHDNYWISDLHMIFNVRDPGTSTVIKQENESLNFPIITINFIVASIFLSFHTSLVFWKTCKSFSWLSAIFDVVTSFGYLVVNSVLSIAIRYNTFMQEPTLIQKPITPLYNEWQCATLLIIGFVSSLLCRCIIFEFGLQRYLANLRSYNQLLEEVKVPSISIGLFHNSREFKSRLRGQIQNFWLNVIGFFLLVLEAGTLIPLACYFIRCYMSSHKTFFLFGFFTIIFIIVIWFFIWIFLSVKQNWLFKMNLPETNHKTYVAEPIYTCFNANKPLSSYSRSTDKFASLKKIEAMNMVPNGDYIYAEHNKKSDLYQLFKLPSEYMGGRIQSVTSIPSHNSNEGNFQGIDTVRRQQNSTNILNGIDENIIADEYAEKISNSYLHGETPFSPLMKTHHIRGMMSQKNLFASLNSQTDSGFQDNRLKNYLHDSFRSVNFSPRRNNFIDMEDNSRADHLSSPYRHNTIGKHETVFGKDNIMDDNTDISTDFSDQNTNSSGVDVKVNNKHRYFQPSTYSENQDDGLENQLIYVHQTGV